MKKLIFTAGLLSFCGATMAQTDILDARTNYSIGQTVTVSGVVTNGGELGPIRYLQDGTAGIAAYGSPATNADLGDTVSFTGVLLDYNGLLELSPTSNAIIHGTAVNPPVAAAIPITSADDNYEGQLVQFVNCTFSTVETTFAGDQNYDLTDGTNTITVRIDADASSIVGQTIPTGPVSVTGLLGQFNDHQVLPRTMADIVPYVAPDKEINITINGDTYLSGDTYVVGNTTNTTITIENTGSGSPLTLSNVIFSGTNAADFGQVGAPSNVAASSTEDFSLIFSPSGTGTREATMTILNNDDDESTYEIHLYAVGTDNLATEPNSSGSALTFPVTEAYALTGSFTPEATAENYLILWRKDAAPDQAPVDGTNYKRGDIVGSATVAYVGPATAFTPRHIIANQNYHFAVYGFNGPAGFENYAASGLTGNATSGGENIGTYYNGISAQSPTLIADLTAKINPHIFNSYGNYKSFVMNQFEIRDTTDGRSVVTCALSGEHKIFDGTFDWTATGYSREHTYAHSWMPTWPADSPYPGLDEYNDYHNLYPANLNQANTPRSNLPLGEVTGSVSFNYLGGTVGQNDDGAMVYEPREIHKGNAARALFYMSVAYNNISGNNWGLPSNQDQDLLKEWHFNDLPDNYEIARHEYIYSKQDNRNPFIDSVEYACYIDFHNMTYLSDTVGCHGGTQSIATNELERLISVFPNPTNTELFIAINELVPDLSVEIRDVNGRVIETFAKEELYYQVNTSKWANGIYIVEIKTPKSAVTRKVVKQ